MTDAAFGPDPDWMAMLSTIELAGHIQITADPRAPTEAWRILLESPVVRYHSDDDLDLAVIQFGETEDTGLGRFVPAVFPQPVARAMNNYPVELLATAAEIDEVIPGDSVHISGFPGASSLAGQRPLVVGGIIASDPRYAATFGDIVKARSVLTHSFSWHGMSGAPVVAWPDSIQDSGRVVGVNAGHFTSRDGSGSVISHFIRSDAVLEILAGLGEPRALRRLLQG